MHECIFNRKCLQERLGGDASLIPEVAQLFIDAAQADVTWIRRAAETGDHEELSGLAHKLKGSASNVCADRLYHAARDMEKSLENGQMQKAMMMAQRLPALMQEFEAAAKEPPE